MPVFGGNRIQRTAATLSRCVYTAGMGPAQSACVCHQFLYKNTNILTTVHAMRQLFIPFCSVQDGEFADMNCLVFWAHCENGKILTKCQVYNKGISPILDIFS